MKQKKMVARRGQNEISINTWAKLALIGLVYIYLAKLVDTLLQGIFKPPVLAVIVVCLNILAGVFQLSFFITYQRQLYFEPNRILNFAVGLAIVGSAVAIIPKLLALTFLFQLPEFYPLLKLSPQISVFSPLIASWLLTIFCMISFFAYKSGGQITLRKALSAGGIGWLVMAISSSVVTINYLSSAQVVWLSEIFKVGPVVFVTVSTITMLGVGYFYYVFASKLIST